MLRHSAVVTHVALNFVFRLCAVIGLLIATPVVAQAPDTPATQDPRAAEFEAAWEEAGQKGQVGPRRIKLLDQGELNLPAGQAFIPAEAANRLMAALGNRRQDGRFGLILPTKAGEDWLIDILWVNEGYVEDGDAKEWQPDAMLDGLKEGTEQDNERRIAEGIAALDIIGWVEQPTYDARAHQLIWSLSARERGAPTSQPQTINYNTYALGRDGYFSLDLITGSDHIATDKAVAKTVLANLTFNPGKRYEDFNASTDKMATYGLAGLVGAVAIKKLGLLAMIGVFLLKAWKIIALVALGITAALRSRFGRLFGKSAPVDEGDPADQAYAIEPGKTETAPDEPVPPSPHQEDHPVGPESDIARQPS